MARSAGYEAARATALAAVEAYDAESARLLAERRAEYARLYGAYEQLGLTWRAAVDSMRELNQLLAAHPDLLAHEPPATERDCE